MYKRRESKTIKSSSTVWKTAYKSISLNQAKYLVTEINHTENSILAIMPNKI